MEGKCCCIRQTQTCKLEPPCDKDYVCMRVSNRLCCIFFRDLCRCVTYASPCSFHCHTSVSKETYVCVKRDLCLSMQLPLSHVCVKRDLCLCQKRPMSVHAASTVTHTNTRLSVTYAVICAGRSLFSNPA
jgi:hypothetical protein